MLEGSKTQPEDYLGAFIAIGIVLEYVTRIPTKSRTPSKKNRAL